MTSATQLGAVAAVNRAPEPAVLAGGAGSSVEDGCKSCAQRASMALAPMPLNLWLSLFEVQGSSEHDCAVYPTVTLGAPAALALGVSSGGVQAMARALEIEIARAGNTSGASRFSTPLNPLAAESARGLAQRCALLKCQAYAALAASFALACQEAAARSDRAFFSCLSHVGFLAQIESLLTTRGDEWAMLGDLSSVVKALSRVQLTAVAPTVSLAEGATTHGTGAGGARDTRPAAVVVKGDRLSPILAFELAELGFRNAEHAASLGMPCGNLVRVHCTIASQGVTDEQTLANVLRTNVAEQERMNLQCLEQLAAYHEQRAAALPTTAAGAAEQEQEQRVRVRIESLLARAWQLLRHPPDPKNIELLHAIASLTRLLGGGRLTVCPNGRDRTAMSLTLEHGRLLQDHGLDEHGSRGAVQTMRRQGVRRENARRSGATRLFDFNGLQQRMLPDALRPPEGTAKGGAIDLN